MPILSSRSRAYYQTISLRPGTDLERSVTHAMRHLADDFPTKVCINEAVGLCEKADKLKSIRTKLKYLAQRSGDS